MENSNKKKIKMKLYKLIIKVCKLKLKIKCDSNNRRNISLGNGMHHFREEHTYLFNFYACAVLSFCYISEIIQADIRRIS